MAVAATKAAPPGVLIAPPQMEGGGGATTTTTTTDPLFCRRRAARRYAVVGGLGLARVFRYVPLVALKGALAGVGLFLLKSAFDACAGAGAPLVASAAIALGLMGGERRWRSPWFLAGTLLLLIALANVVLASDTCCFYMPLQWGMWGGCVGGVGNISVCHDRSRRMR